MKLVLLLCIATLSYCQNCNQFSNCLSCNSSGCTQCMNNYAFTYNTTNCVLCNGTDQTELSPNGSTYCYKVIDNCANWMPGTVDPSTLICPQCYTGYSSTNGGTSCYSEVSVTAGLLGTILALLLILMGVMGFCYYKQWKAGNLTGMMTDRSQEVTMLRKNWHSQNWSICGWHNCEEKNISPSLLKRLIKSICIVDLVLRSWKSWLIKMTATLHKLYIKNS
jgi:hypothetical protein